MPTPGRTNIEAIVRAAADLLEASGPDGLSMQAVAARVGVRAPSLYKHVAGRGDLLRLVAEDAARDIGARVDAAAPPGMPPRVALGAAVRALRGFARERPAAFRMVFSPGGEAVRADPQILRQSAATVLRIGRELAGAERALEAARTLTAWASGFVAMELADAFRMGGDVDAAFDYGIERLAAALAG